MEAGSTPRTSANFHQTTLRNKPGDRPLHIRRRDGLKSHRLPRVTLVLSSLMFSVDCKFVYHFIRCYVVI
jgi:hypothetical protein